MKVSAESVDATGRSSVGQASGEDLALIARIVAGDEAAFVALVDRHHAVMARIAKAIVGDEAQAADVVQEAWMAIVESFARFEGRSSLKTWMFRILTNRAKTHAARAGRTIAFSAMPEDTETAVDPGRFTAIGSWRAPLVPWSDEHPEGDLLRKEMAAVLAREIDNLPPAQRSVVLMRDVDGLTGEEICAILEITEANFRVLLHRGRSRLRGAIERELGREAR
jgi:RNA polymerase sigma-70 factor (ECF subfamily)